MIFFEMGWNHQLENVFVEGDYSNALMIFGWGHKGFEVLFFTTLLIHIDNHF